MKTSMKTRILTAFVMLGMAGMASRSYAQPVAYAVSESNLTLGSVTFNGEPSGTNNANVSALFISDASDATASLNGVSTTSSATPPSTSFVGTTIPLQQAIAPGSTFSGPTPSTSAPFAATGQQNGVNYSYASAILPSVETQNTSGVITSYITASSIAEVNVNAGSKGNAQAQNTSNSEIQLTFTTDTSETIGVSATLQSLIQAAVNVTGLGNEAQATQAINVTLENASTGAVLVDWNPNGSTNGSDVTGSDAANVTTTEPGNPTTNNLNASITENTLQNTGTLTPGGAYSITMADIAAGTYTLTLNQQNTVNAQAAPSVPEPGTIALMGAGLLGLGAFYRRKKA